MDGKGPAARGPEAFYKVLNHTADFAFEISGQDMGTLLGAAILSVVDAMFGLATLRPQKDLVFQVEEEDKEMAIFKTLAEVLYRFETEGLIPCEVSVEDKGQGRFGIRMACDIYDPSRHIHKVIFKAPTLHGLKVEEGKDGLLRAQVVMDV